MRLQLFGLGKNELSLDGVKTGDTIESGLLIQLIHASTLHNGLTIEEIKRTSYSHLSDEKAASNFHVWKANFNEDRELVVRKGDYYRLILRQPGEDDSIGVYVKYDYAIARQKYAEAWKRGNGEEPDYRHAFMDFMECYTPLLPGMKGDWYDHERLLYGQYCGKVILGLIEQSGMNRKTTRAASLFRTALQYDPTLAQKVKEMLKS